MRLSPDREVNAGGRKGIPPAPARVSAGPAGRGGVAWQVGQFALAGLVAVLIVGLGMAVASRRVGERQAIADVRVTTLSKAKGVVEPLLTDGVVAGDPEALAALSAAVARDVLSGSLVRVKIWAPDGRVVFSDEPRIVGSVYELGPDEQDALRTGRIDAEGSDLSKPENRFERPFGELLEVYLPVRTTGGQPLLFEAYYRFDIVATNGSKLWRSFAPIALGALVMLEVVQIPLAWSLARRLRLRLREREGLLQRALEASEVERRQIASDLHDGVVQDLAGVAYALSASARSATNGTAGDPAVLEESAEVVRDSIRALRSLVVDIYPPDLADEGLESALTDLLARADDEGLRPTLDVAGMRDPVPDAVSALLYRAAQEGLRNVLSHARAATVLVRVETAGGRATLEVVDDGDGFDADGAGAASAAPGHVGLKALAGLVADAGGVLHVRSAPGSGTTLRVEVPLP
ncbi:MAG: two-component system, NarL family, sensor kinase [Actinomycetota bacterium]|nr:two-component system, NarL family, sensor kinase [Actinomycetota bacterium]